MKPSVQEPDHLHRLAGVVAADSLRCPLASSSFDAVLCIAVLHHMSTVERRVSLLREIARLLVPGGKAFVTVVSACRVERGVCNSGEC